MGREEECLKLSIALTDKQSKVTKGHRNRLFFFLYAGRGVAGREVGGLLVV